MRGCIHELDMMYRLVYKVKKRIHPKEMRNKWAQQLKLDGMIEIFHVEEQHKYFFLKT